MRVVEGVVGHHTATGEGVSGDYPSLRVVRDGRAGLSGPLANYGLGRSGTIYVIAAGCAWHAGASRHGGFTDLNDEFLGIEAEDSGDGKWNPAMLDAYPKLVGAILRYMRRDVSRYVSHRTCAVPAGRKPDPGGLADTWMRDRAKGGTQPAPVQPTPTGGGAWPRLLREGLHGPDVLAWQRYLVRFYGLPAAWADGVFERPTTDYTKRFQANHPPEPVLLADGIVGPKTLAKAKLL
jgi:N-acetyl-anhydromuramyl-L-alanine amidase AmpD